MNVANVRSSPLYLENCSYTSKLACIVGVALVFIGILANPQVGVLANMGSSWYYFELGALASFVVAAVCSCRCGKKTEREKEIDKLVGKKLYAEAAIKGDLESMCVVAVHHTDIQDIFTGMYWAEEIAKSYSPIRKRLDEEMGLNPGDNGMVLKAIRNDLEKAKIHFQQQKMKKEAPAQKYVQVFSILEEDKKLSSMELYKKGAKAYRDNRFPEAFAYFEAADQYGPALVFKAEMLEKGEGVAKNEARALVLYEIAARSHNNFEAMCILALHYFKKHAQLSGYEWTQKAVGHAPASHVKTTFHLTKNLSDQEKITMLTTALETDREDEAFKRLYAHI